MSLQTRLSLTTAVASALVFVVSAVVIYVVIRTTLLAEFDRALETTAHSLAADIEQKGDELELEVEDLMLTRFSPGESPEYYQVWVEDNASVFTRSPSLAGKNLPHVPSALGEVRFGFLDLPDGRRGRLVGLTFTPTSAFDPEDDELPTTPPKPLTATLVLAAATTEVDAALERLAKLLTAVMVVGIAALVLLQIAGVRTGLRPLVRLEAEIERLDAENLAARVSAISGPRELVPVVTRLNELLDRLEEAFQRERTFTSDLTHELRTPVAGIRAQLDVALSKDRSAGDYKAVLQTCRNICRDMHAMVESLLALARLDAGRTTASQHDVSLPATLRDCWTQYAQIAAARQLHVTWDVEEAAVVIVDPHHLQLIANNVFDNAVSHCDPGGAVAIKSASWDSRVVFSVRNSGSQVAAAHTPRVFDRLWRGDAARADTETHSGLGLSIVKKLVLLSGGTIHVASEAGGDFEVEINLPKAVGTGG